MAMTRFEKLTAREWSIYTGLTQRVIPALIAMALPISVKMCRNLVETHRL